MDIVDKTKLEALAQEVFPHSCIESAKRLGGMTNRTYQVKIAGANYVFRIPGEGTSDLINRSDEKISNALACKLDIDAQVLYFDGKTGLKVSEYIEGAKTMSAENMRESKNIAEAAHLLNRLHTCKENTQVAFEVFNMAGRYESIITSNNVALYDDYDEVRQQVMAIKNALDELKVEKTPCHNDPLCENWVRDVSRMYLVDWEYAGMNDPLWDVADVSIEADFDQEKDMLFLREYFQGEPNEETIFRFNANKVFLDFLWSLWGKTRVPFDGQPLEDYAFKRYARMKNNLASMKS